MMQVHFVDAIPRAEAIEDNHLYVSLKYNMTSHRCASGCGQLVPLPLSPADWSLTYDGETISLNPSIGNGILACQSHYFIRKSEIVWLSDMTAVQARQQQEADSELLGQHMRRRTSKEGKQSLAKRAVIWLQNLFGRR
jgi:hypothetical protein